MSKLPPTRASLLVRLRDPQDPMAWREFVEVYGPVIHGFALRRGLQDADAADVTQEVLRAVARAMARFDYDPARGTFRGWLFTITQNKLLSARARQRREVPAHGGTDAVEWLQQQPDHRQEEDVWNEEHRSRLFQWAMEKVRFEFSHSTWEAFLATSIRNEPARAVADELKISVGAVYIAKSRVLARIRSVIESLESETE